MSIALRPYPGLPAPPLSIEAEALRLSADRLELRFGLSGPAGAVRVPAIADPARVDELWKHTCFEAFIRPAGDSETYVEINLAPSRQWAAYAFDRYRAGMRSADVALEAIEVSATPQRLDLVATLSIPAAGVGSVWRLALTAVIEDVGGGLSYWSLRHPAGRPDFHDPVGLALELR